jgi:Fibronectin type III domain
MSIYPRTPRNFAPASMISAARISGAAATPPPTPTPPATQIPNAPSAPSLAQGSGSDLAVTWAAPAVDSAHSAATWFNLRFSHSGANTWTTASNVTTPYELSGLTAGAAYDVQVQGVDDAGAGAWSASSTLTTASGVAVPNAPSISSAAPPPDGTTSNLTVAWTAPTVDGTHSAATGYNLRYSPSGAGTWTTVSGVNSPYSITGLSGAAAIDVQVQAINASANVSAWSSIATGNTWGVAVAPGNLTVAAAQVHGTNVAPSGGANITATPAPTAVAGAAFSWSASPSVLPTTNLIATSADGQANGWGQYISAPATAGTYYLWMLAQNASGTTIGALVSSAITVS